MTTFGSGLINHTWLVQDAGKDYILQKINTKVFQHPEYIAHNIEAINVHIKRKHPGYFFVAPVETTTGETMYHHDPDGYFRLFHFVKNSICHEVAQTPQHAFEAARQFGLFTKMLADFPARELRNTLPKFHQLRYRYNQMEYAIEHGNQVRVRETKNEIEFLKSLEHLVVTFDELTASKDFKLRVIHHDTKISNVLFDKHGKGICIIDLDTVMPGYFISDVGDMMRTYLSPVSEEEQDLTKIIVREDYFEVITRGYLQEMSQELTSFEISYFVYSGMFMMYMQAIRFLTDHINDDQYYGSAYAGHNLVRATNQMTLLEKYIAKEKLFQDIVAACAVVKKDGKHSKRN